MYFPYTLSVICDCATAPRDDEHLKQLIFEYDRQGIKSPKMISNLLLAEHNIQISRKVIQTIPDTMKCQLVLDQLKLDPGRCQGPRLIKEGIHMCTGIDLTCDFFKEEMRLQDLEGFTLHNPTSKGSREEHLSASGSTKNGVVMSMIS
ncbi:hypothetical protein M422DRAFT_186406 [Sphaerobolus stellatus SS14]|uniref:Unplaced genomic scaffold SPHSTscaffold_174, whole genome shotgun sequence n=1 Tax=Sphaerobolus stellatus (strain SS14) TaxID=990650 RepID=A0A0C9UPV5_SPHS4|nr:hypothetical protein M422DRAFT_186406 [Sphaerobolus stellatus SS14]